MPDAILTSKILPTAMPEGLLADEAGRPATIVTYRGAPTPQRLDAPERETAALLSGAAVHDLGWLRRVAVRGEDRFRWLSGMVTNAVETLPMGMGAYNLVLNAQGRIQGDCYVWRDEPENSKSGNELELEVNADQFEALMAHFDRFIIMDDVELVPMDGESALGLTGPEGVGILEALGLPALDTQLTSKAAMLAVDGEAIPVRVTRGYGTLVPHFVLWIQTEKTAAVWRVLTVAGATPVGAEAVEMLRVVEGIPAYGIDIQSRDLAQETAQERALSFIKGCYLGQEIVERIRSRGQVHRHLRSMELKPADENSTEVPAAGIELRVARETGGVEGKAQDGKAGDGKAVANLTSVATVEVGGGRRVFAIGMVRAEAEVQKQTLVYDGGTAEILNGPLRLADFNGGERRAAEEKA